VSRPGSLTLCSRRTHRKHLDLSPVLADPEKLRRFISGAVEADAALTEKSTAPGSQIELRQKWSSGLIECHLVALILQTQGRRRERSRREAVKNGVR